MSNLQIEIDYEGKKEAAESIGWCVPDRPVNDGEASAWVRYWDEMELHDERVAAGDKDPGRPVVPHRTGPHVCSDCDSVVRLSKEKRDEFESLARPLMAFLSTNLHPHTHAIIDSRQAEVSEGLCVFSTDDYLKG